MRLQPDASAMGHLSGTAIGLVTQQHRIVPLTECRVTGDKTRRVDAAKDIICYSYPLSHTA
jgi:hypothetical protein